MKNIRILWEKVCSGTIWVEHGTMSAACSNFTGLETEVSFESSITNAGPNATLVHVETEYPFSFFLRDVSSFCPIYLPKCGVIVTDGDDFRSYEQIINDIASKNGKSKREQLSEEAEYDFDRAASETLDLKGPIWLGISKDMRLFQVAFHGKASGHNDQVFDVIQPRFASVGHREADLPEIAGQPYSLRMLTGRGIGCRNQVSKRLEDGCLPILNSVDVDGDMIYRTTMFATLEKNPLDSDHIRGTDMYVADACCGGYKQTKEQQEHTAALLDGEFSREEETVLYVRVVAENTSKAPVYSYLLTPIPQVEENKLTFSPETGYTSLVSSGRVCVTARLNDFPLFSREAVVLLQPGEKAVFDFRIPHTPVSPERAEALANQSFDQRLAEAKRFWNGELAEATEIRLPEKRIEEMIRAGILHLEIGYYGKNPAAPVVPSNGNYAAIGSESSPGIQFLDAAGKNELAARALQFFVEKQHEDGFMQNLDGYMLETGSVLWTMGEHWRLTRDVQWAGRVHDSIVKAAEYLIRWREQNLDDTLKNGNGYGMIKGKVADPEDHFHSFMLNAGAYAGLASAGEILNDCDPENAARYQAIAAEMRENIRESLARSMALSPAIPISDGTWIRSFSAWPEYTGPLSLYAEGGTWHSHGSFMARDMLGASYLVLQGVVDADEPMGEDILAFCAEYLTLNNTAFSQSYYSPHPYGQLLRGDVRLYLQEFYSAFSGLADRETYSFWEHFFCGSPHKLHEESWFLMRCRWMLALENYKKSQLRLLAGVPRKWLEDGKNITVKNLRTYYGSIDLAVCSEVSAGKIGITLSLENKGFPALDSLFVRVPHPDGRKAVHVSAGRYDPNTETIELEPFSGKMHFDVFF
ncbi:MAG: hypothetical protein PUB00_00490 [Clostridiales bacterium]|nr:hypothetical protein [Clostridiales bacterium]